MLGKHTHSCGCEFDPITNKIAKECSVHGNWLRAELNRQDAIANLTERVQNLSRENQSMRDTLNDERRRLREDMYQKREPEVWIAVYIMGMQTGVEQPEQLAREAVAQYRAEFEPAEGTSAKK